MSDSGISIGAVVVLGIAILVGDLALSAGATYERRSMWTDAHPARRSTAHDRLHRLSAWRATRAARLGAFVRARMFFCLPLSGADRR